MQDLALFRSPGNKNPGLRDEGIRAPVLIITLSALLKVLNPKS